MAVCGRSHRDLPQIQHTSRKNKAAMAIVKPKTVAAFELLLHWTSFFRNEFK